MGAALRARAERLTGVDLSPAMIAMAAGNGRYDSLVTGDAATFLTGSAPGAFDCIAAADALCYVGDLSPIFDACARSLAAGGLFAFSIETFDGEGYRLQATMRFAHGRPHIERIARVAGLRPVSLVPASSRREAGADVPGLIGVFAAPA